MNKILEALKRRPEKKVLVQVKLPESLHHFGAKIIEQTESDWTKLITNLLSDLEQQVSKKKVE